jgi:hypothetical protein
MTIGIWAGSVRTRLLPHRRQVFAMRQLACFGEDLDRFPALDRLVQNLVDVAADELVFRFGNLDPYGQIRNGRWRISRSEPQADKGAIPKHLCDCHNWYWVRWRGRTAGHQNIGSQSPAELS